MNMSVSQHRALIVIITLLVSTCSRMVEADLYDLSADWSDTNNNPNGAWTYLVNGSAPDTSYTRGGDPFYNSPGYQPIWAHENGTYFGWSKNNGSNVREWDLKVGDVYGHTAGVLAIQWTSPLTGPAHVSGGVWAIRDIGRSNYWQVTLDGCVLADGYVYGGDGYDRSNPDPIDLSFDVSTGQVVTFSAWPDNTYGNGTQDYIALDLSINIVPLPAAVILGILGLGGAALRLRKYA